MPNHLSLPLKKTYPVQIRAPVRDYLHNHSQDHPDLYKYDISQWEALRAPCILPDARNDAADAFLWSVPRLGLKIGLTFCSYHAQLVFVLTKFPSDVCAIQCPSIHSNPSQFRSASNSPMLTSLLHHRPSRSRFAACLSKGLPYYSTWPPFTPSSLLPRTGPVMTV